MIRNTAVIKLARKYQVEQKHAAQVTRLALALFDALRAVHRLGAVERAWLKAAARLHDIGWIAGRQQHHKTARRIIRETPALATHARERQILGEIVRYHRKALPQLRHRGFRKLSLDDRRRVQVLAGLLRVADGLDVSHAAVVMHVSCRILPARLTLCCRTRGPAEAECAAARKKGRLLEKVLHRKLKICHPT